MTPEELIDHYSALAAAQYSGRKVLLAGAPLAAYSDQFLEGLLDSGAAGLFIAASGVGTGPLPSEALAERIVLEGEPAHSIMEGIRGSARMLADPPPELVEALERWDAAGEAVVIGDGFSSFGEIAGRRVLGARPAEFTRLEDKVVIDAVWDAAGVARAPASVVPRDLRAVVAAFDRHDSGEGVVLAADASRGWHGGAAGVRWARSKSDLGSILEAWADTADLVRVMPFLEGVPSSIHGIVFPQATAVFRPCEMLVFRQPGSPEFVYSGSATVWDPAPEDRQAMRDLARRAGEQLRATVDYRGGFTIDGVLTSEGFLPTELNTRLGAAFGQVGGALPGMSWGTLQRSLIDRVPFDHPVEEVERLVLEKADAHRSVRAVSFGRGRRMEETVNATLVTSGDGYQVVSNADGAVGSVMVGPHVMGYFARLGFEEGHLVPGRPCSVPVARALHAVDRHWLLGIGELEPARQVR